MRIAAAIVPLAALAVLASREVEAQDAGRLDPPHAYLAERQALGTRLHVSLGTFKDGARKVSRAALQGAEPFEIYRLSTGPDGRPEKPAKEFKLDLPPVAWGKPNDDNSVFIVEQGLNPANEWGHWFVVRFGDKLREKVKDIPREFQFQLKRSLESQQKAKDEQAEGALYKKEFWLTDHSKLDVAVRSVTSDKSKEENVAVDLDYRLDAVSEVLVPSLYLDLDFKIEATVTLDREDENFFHTQVKAAAGGTLSWYYDAGAGGRNRIGLVLAPSSFEASQDFDVVNYTAESRLEVWIPWTNLPALETQELIGTRSSGVLAPTARGSLGFTTVENAKTPEGTPDSEKDRLEHDRLSAKMYWLIPFSRRLEFEAKVQWIYVLNAESDADRYQSLRKFALRYYTDESQASAVEIVYASGSVEPEFLEDQTLSMGWSLKF